MVTGSGGVGRRGNWMKAVKMYKLSATRSIRTRDIMYNMINITTTAICYMTVIKRVNPNLSHHKEKNRCFSGTLLLFR